MMRATERALDTRPPDIQKALVFGRAVKSILGDNEVGQFNAIRHKIMAALAREVDRGPNERVSGMANLKSALPLIGQTEGRLTEVLTSRLAKDLASGDSHWLATTLEAANLDDSHAGVLGNGIRKGSEQLSMQDARRWTDGIKRQAPQLAPYCDIGYAYAVRRERGRQAALMIFDTVIGRYPETEVAEIAQRERRKIRFQSGVLSPGLWVLLSLAGICGYGFYALQVHPNSSNRVAFLRKYVILIYGRTESIVAATAGKVAVTHSDPESHTNRYLQMLKAKATRYGAICKSAAMPWNLTDLDKFSMKTLWKFAGCNALLYLLAHLFSGSGQSMGEVLVATIWNLLVAIAVSAGVIFILRSIFRRRSNLLPYRLVPIWSILFPVFVFPIFRVLFILGWWICAAMAFGRAVYGDWNNPGSNQTMSSTEGAVNGQDNENGNK